jgi:hypothetical protein
VVWPYLAPRTATFGSLGRRRNAQRPARTCHRRAWSGLHVVPRHGRHHSGFDPAKVATRKDVAGLGHHRSACLHRDVVQPCGGGHPSRGAVQSRPAHAEPAVGAEKPPAAQARPVTGGKCLSILDRADMSRKNCSSPPSDLSPHTRASGSSCRRARSQAADPGEQDPLNGVTPVDRGTSVFPGTWTAGQLRGMLLAGVNRIPAPLLRNRRRQRRSEVAINAIPAEEETLDEPESKQVIKTEDIALDFANFAHTTT